MGKHENFGAQQDGSRFDSRTELTLSAMIIRSGKQLRVVLRDLSENGAAATTSFPPGPNERIRLSCRGMAIDCRVIWAKGNIFGFAFDQSLTPPQMQALRDSGSISDRMK